MTACPTCGRDLPEGALFCPDCGAKAVGLTLVQQDMSPSHFNTGMTATSPPMTTDPTAPAGEAGLPAPSTPAEERKRSFFAGKRGLLLAAIVILAVVLLGTTLEGGTFGSGTAPAVNSSSNPLTGGQLYAAYASNESQATASYTNKTVYIQDSLDFGVGRDYATGQYYSSVDSGNVVLFWSSQARLSGLSAGSSVLARCSVSGEQASPGAGYLLVLEDCSLVSVQPQTAPGVNVSVNND